MGLTLDFSFDQDLCDNYIVSVGFGSTNHRDTGDKVDKEWASLTWKAVKEKVESSMNDAKTSVKERGQQIKKYFENYRVVIGETLWKRTICAWTSLRETPEGNEECQYLQYFVLDSLGIAHNISSRQLEDKNVGTYGGLFFSGHVSHATSVPVGVDEEGKIYLSPNEKIPIAFAWGR